MAAESLCSEDFFNCLTSLEFQTIIKTGASSIMLQEPNDDPIRAMPIFAECFSSSQRKSCVSSFLEGPMSTVNRHC
jgi:hypothetical protein